MKTARDDLIKRLAKGHSHRRVLHKISIKTNTYQGRHSVNGFNALAAFSAFPIEQ
jgi:hypothetical protein